ncbi:MAG: glycosyltransferase [Acidobacteria bacterium]|nr:glycosyltransferase [Acidobacteriota bacterium]
MKVLLVHNFYQKLGGEDVSVDAEADLLESRGHEVIRYSRRSADVSTMPAWKVALGAVWSPRTFLEVRALIKSRRPDVLHCTNNFPLVSPSVYEAASVESVPVVQALRNYRSMCANACFFRNDKPCEICLTKSIAWPAVVNACYKSSRTASSIFLAWQWMQRAADSKISRYYTLTDFARTKYLAAGFDPDRVDVKPNFIDPDPGPGPRDGGYALFAGRLSPEKGIEVLLKAWRIVGDRGLLKIVGDGPDQPLVQQALAEGLRCEYLGQQPQNEVLNLAGGASFVIMSSTVFETFGRTIIEAFSRGVPVIVPRLGALGELVRDGVTGLCFEPGDSEGLARCAIELIGNPSLCRRMGEAARLEYERHYTADANHLKLVSIYQRAIETQRGGSSDPRKSEDHLRQPAGEHSAHSGSLACALPSDAPDSPASH